MHEVVMNYRNSPLTGIFFYTIVMGASMSASADYPIAGVEPGQRPQGAPVMEWVQHDKSWFQHSLTGINPPYPRSLYFLDNQGDWHTPFNRPGMRGRYDIRGWHQ
jgi:hypothetical protein